MIEVPENKLPLCRYPLGLLLGDSITSSLCVNIEKGAEVWVVTGMLIRYLESFTDSVVVRENDKPIGIVGGKDIIEGVCKNPSSDFFDKKVEDVMEKKLIAVSKNTTLKQLLEGWAKTRRAFAVIPNELLDYSAISAKKILEIGKRCKTQMTISDIPKKTVEYFGSGDSIGTVINSMLEKKTRKLVLRGSTQFINDRIIIEKISDLNYLRNVDNFLELPVNGLKLEHAKVISDNLTIPEISRIMYEMNYPYLLYQDQVVSPWDICAILQSNRIHQN